MKLNLQKLLTFICAIWPGGGYMYYGMMRKGAALMALFTALLGLTLTVGWKFLAFLIPVLWCYCFFDTFHVAQLAVQEREREDREFFQRIVDFLRDDPLKHLEDKRTYTGVMILLLALYTVVYGVLLPFFRWGEQFRVVRMLLTAIPTAVVAVLLFMVGKHILQKEQERKEAQQFAEDAAFDGEQSMDEAGKLELKFLVTEPIVSERIEKVDRTEEEAQNVPDEAEEAEESENEAAVEDETAAVETEAVAEETAESENEVAVAEEAAEETVESEEEAAAEEEAAESEEVAVAEEDVVESAEEVVAEETVEETAESAEEAVAEEEAAESAEEAAVENESEPIAEGAASAEPGKKKRIPFRKKNRK